MRQRYWEKDRGSLGQTLRPRKGRVLPWPCGQYGLMGGSFHGTESLGSQALSPHVAWKLLWGGGALWCVLCPPPPLIEGE